MKQLSQPELVQIRTALEAGRRGRATLTQLAAAHDLATAGQLSGCLGELRDLIRACTPTPPFRNEAKSIILGVISGIFANMLLTHVRGRQLGQKG